MAIPTRAHTRIILAGAIVIFLSLFYFRNSLHISENIEAFTTLYDTKQNAEPEVWLQTHGEDCPLLKSGAAGI